MLQILVLIPVFWSIFPTKTLLSATQYDEGVTDILRRLLRNVRMVLGLPASREAGMALKKFEDKFSMESLR